MNRRMNRRSLLTALLISACGLAMPALGASSKLIEQSIDAADLERLSLDISVAELEIEAYDGDQIELQVDLQSQRRWFALRRPSVDDIELRVDANGPRLSISLKEDNLEQHWRMRVPSALALQIELGVGDVLVENFANNLDMELGVGAVQIEVADIDFASIHASAGVGDANVRGFARGADNERSFISADAYYHGEGDFQIEVEVGVGDVVVRRD